MANLSNINNKFIVTDGGNVLIGGNISGSSILQVAGNSRFSGEIRTANRLAIQETYFGYSSSYKVIQLGESAATKAISLGYNPNANTSGSFSGNEILIPNNIRILAPAANNNGYYGLMMLNSSNKVLLGSSNYLIESNYIMALDTATKNVGIGTSGPGEKLEIAGNIRIHNSTNAPYIDFVESGATTDSKARITMDQIDGSNGTLQFSTESAGTLSTRMTLSQHGQLKIIGSEGWSAANNTEVIGHSVLEISPVRNGTNNSLCVFAVAGNLAAIQAIDSSSNNLQKLPINPFGGNVGIGDADPAYRLSVTGSLDERVQINSTANKTAGIYMRVISGGTLVGTGTIATQNDGNMKFFTGTSGEAVAMTLDTDGRLQDTAGIYLGSNNNNQLLNYYKEDTWTPQIYYQNGTDQLASQNTTQTGLYTKIGNTVLVQFRLIWTITGTPAVDNIGIKNLPWQGHATNAFAEIPCFIKNYTGGPSPRGNLTLTLPTANQTLALFNDTNFIGNMGNAIGTGTHEIRFSFTYLTN